MTKAAFIKHLFQQHGSDLKRYVAHKFSDPDDAEDIVQDAFHNFLRNKNPKQIENPRAYLYQTAHNLALNRIRKQRNHQNAIEQDEEVHDTRSPETYAQARDDLARVEKVLRQLPDQCREAFLLSRVKGKPYGDIAQELGVSVSSVEKYLARTVKLLKENFDDLP